MSLLVIWITIFYHYILDEEERHFQCINCQTARNERLLLCGFRKYAYPHHRGSLEILRGRGVLKAKIF